MSRAFDLLVTPLVQREGGYSSDANDSGGATRYGITEAVARAWGYTGPMSELPLATAKAIYKARYWDSLLLDEVEQLVPRVAEELFDSGVNCGTGKAGEWLQRALNAFNQQGSWYADLTVDGRVGRMTVAALGEYIKRRGVEKGQRVLLRALDSLQCVHYIELSQSRQKDEAFVFGWIDNRCGV
jgi:lysozyme family protein